MCGWLPWRRPRRRNEMAKGGGLGGQHFSMFVGRVSALYGSGVGWVCAAQRRRIVATRSPFNLIYNTPPYYPAVRHNLDPKTLFVSGIRKPKRVLSSLFFVVVVLLFFSASSSRLFFLQFF